jgi:hypothetical protein
MSISNWAASMSWYSRAAFAIAARFVADLCVNSRRRVPLICLMRKQRKIRST